MARRKIIRCPYSLDPKTTLGLERIESLESDLRCSGLHGNVVVGDRFGTEPNQFAHSLARGLTLVNQTDIHNPVHAEVPRVVFQYHFPPSASRARKLHSGKLFVSIPNFRAYRWHIGNVAAKHDGSNLLHVKISGIRPLRVNYGTFEPLGH